MNPDQTVTEPLSLPANHANEAQEPIAAAPQPVENVYSVKNLINALDERHKQELLVREQNRESIENLEKILGALRLIA